MPASRRVIYWDSCVWLAWLKKEEHTPEDWQGMDEVAHMVHSGKWLLLGSYMIHTEVLAAELPPEVAANFKRLLNRPNFQLVDADARIGVLSGELRAFYVQRNREDGLGSLDGMDAVHLATAIHYRADEFHTFDEGKKQKPKGRSLLTLSGNVAGYPLVVTKPRALQGRLAF